MQVVVGAVGSTTSLRSPRTVELDGEAADAEEDPSPATPTEPMRARDRNIPERTTALGDRTGVCFPAAVISPSPRDTVLADARRVVVPQRPRSGPESAIARAVSLRGNRSRGRDA
jgi:hypothetical protein